MPIASEALPYGLRDVKIAPLTATGAAGTKIDLPNSRTFSFEESEDFEELRGDDKIVATRGKGPSVEWELEAGGISLEAYVVLNGGALVVTGTTPNVKKTYTKKGTDARPEFFVEGQALSESGGDFHAILYRCKATGGVSGELSDGSFLLTSGSGSALSSKDPAKVDVLYDLIHNETTAAIV